CQSTDEVVELVRQVAVSFAPVFRTLRTASFGVKSRRRLTADRRSALPFPFRKSSFAPCLRSGMISA
ncbi:MAG: hypothetical protein ABSE84_24370, partial [Isosphaeraceae bacterium]